MKVYEYERGRQKAQNALNPFLSESTDTNRVQNLINWHAVNYFIHIDDYILMHDSLERQNNRLYFPKPDCGSAPLSSSNY